MPYCNGREVVYLPLHPVAMKNNYALVYRIILFEKFGSKLITNKTVVHHVDGNKNNDELTNLVICEDHAYHRLLHQRKNALKNTGDVHSRKCAFCGIWILSHESEVFRTKRKRSQGIYERWVHKKCARDYDEKRRDKKNKARREKRRRLKELKCEGLWGNWGG